MMPVRPFKILIVDDEYLIRSSLCEILSAEGYVVASASSAEEAEELCSKEVYDVILLDLVLPKMDGLEFMMQLKERGYPAEVVMITAYSTVESAVQAMKAGAYDYLIKPCNNEEIKLLIQRLKERWDLQQENLFLREELRHKNRLEDIIGRSERMQEVFELIRTVSGAEATVLIQGETGTGKELVARAIHKLSPRKNKPFVKIDCASLPAELLESELFGHQKGAFTGAHETRRGRVELAHGGTLFLDEIGYLPLKLQSKLLRLVQERAFERVGENETHQVDVRILSATNLDIEAAVAKEMFSRDLYYRLNVFTIQLPPLRERKEDIPLLAEHFLELYTRQNKKNIKGFHPNTVKLLFNYDWPGNVRELKNCIERAVLVEKGEVIQPGSLPPQVASPAPAALGEQMREVNFKREVCHYKRELVIDALRRAGGVKKEAALILGISPRNLSYYIKKFKIRPVDYR